MLKMEVYMMHILGAELNLHKKRSTFSFDI